MVVMRDKICSGTTSSSVCLLIVLYSPASTVMLMLMMMMMLVVCSKRKLTDGGEDREGEGGSSSHRKQPEESEAVGACAGTHSHSLTLTACSELPPSSFLLPPSLTPPTPALSNIDHMCSVCCSDALESTQGQSDQAA